MDLSNFYGNPYTNTIINYNALTFLKIMTVNAIIIID